MKNYLKFMLAAFATVAAVSCAKEEIEAPNVQEETQTPDQENVQLVPLTLNVTGDNAADTKTDIADNNKTVVWCEDDAIAVYDASGVWRKFTIKEGTIDGGSALFEGEVAEGTTDIYAVYPFDAAVSCADGKVVATTMTEQTIESGKVADGAIVAVAKGEAGNALQFKNVVGIFRMDVSYEDVTEIYLDGAALAGTATFDPATGVMETESATDASDFVTLLPAGETFAKGSYFIPLLPGTTPKGDFHITMVRKENKGAVHTANGEVTIPRNLGFFVDDTKLTESFVIKDAATLQTFLTNAKDYDATHVATVIRDLDLTGVTIKSATTYAGTFNGGNHSIKNWSTTSAKPLFTAIAEGATVKNLVLDSSCKFTLAETDSKQAFVVATNAGIVSGVTNKASINYTRATDKPMQSRYFGTIVGYSTGLVSDCHNEGNITVNIPVLDYTETSGNTYQHQRVGGVVGVFKVESGVVGVTGCTNKGNITFNFNGVSSSSADPHKQFRPHFAIGGVCAMAANNGSAAMSSEAVNNGTIEQCTNSGAVKLYQDGINGSNYSNVGGVIGYLEGTIKECKNIATERVSIEMKNASTVKVSAPAVGGVVGTALKGDILNCSNEGPVYITGYVQGGTNDAAYSGGDEKPAIGGVVAKAGAKAEDTTLKIQDCKNSGEVSGTIWNSNNIRMGGIVGWTSIPVVGSAANTLENSGEVVLKSSTTFLTAYVGGVIGHSISTCDKIYNTGNITVNQKSTTDNQKAYIGGAAGYMSKAAGGVFKQVQNRGNVTVTSTSAKTVSNIGGCIGRGESTSVTSNGNSWATCNTNYGKITVNVPAVVYVGGVIGYPGKGSGIGSTPSEFKYCKNGGDIEVISPADKSYIGGVFGYQYRGALGNANACGQASDKVSIKVTGATSATCVGAYVGMMYTDHGAVNGQYHTMRISGCGIYGSIDAEGATAGVVAGRLEWMGGSTTNCALLGSSASERPKISKAFTLNGVKVGDLLDAGTHTVNTFFGAIVPSTNSGMSFNGPDGEPMLGRYLFFASGSKTTASPYIDGLQFAD